jgi:hypothetical protein
VRLRAEQVDSHLSKNFAPVYLVHGDEALLVLEAADAVRAAARKRGHSEREVLFVDKGFDWGAFTQSAASQSLFGDRKIVELRLASGKPGAAAAQAIEAYCGNPNPDMALLITMPRPEGPGWWKSAWYAAVDAAGVIVEAQPVSRAQLPQWIAQRLARQRQRAGAETLELMADRVEGNLLAAGQEILSSPLLSPEGELSAMKSARRSSVARTTSKRWPKRSMRAMSRTTRARARRPARRGRERGGPRLAAGRGIRRAAADQAADGRRQDHGKAVRRQQGLARRAAALRKSAQAPRCGPPAGGRAAHRAHRTRQQGRRQRRALG